MMDKTISRLLSGKIENHILPFFWQHGEDEATLRKYMNVIKEANIGAVCVESRPHPDYCGPLWWRDMDIIIDEAKKLDMKVWILDDSHFPTGFANGVFDKGLADNRLRRQSYVRRQFSLPAGISGAIDISKHLKLEYQPGPMERRMLDMAKTMVPENNQITEQEISERMGLRFKKQHIEDDKILAVYSYDPKTLESIDLTDRLDINTGILTLPDGVYPKIGVGILTKNLGVHQNYINMLSDDSCRLLIDEVYEKHYAHYSAEFGNVIAGFFSDEPELGNGSMYNYTPIFEEYDLPWSNEIGAELEKRLGGKWKLYMAALADAEVDCDLMAKIRYAYMDSVTRLVQKAFSEQVGNWCADHGVEYIGHIIEDNNNHARVGSSLGHYFRGLAGQHMAGIDEISWQMAPDYLKPPKDGTANITGIGQDSEFYQFTQAKLASSAAAIEKKKQGRAMVECFGAYGWNGGVRVQKHVTDHLLFNGLNYFVPHAFTPKAFPDPDCPPHYYAHGHNPQYRHFSQLMLYINRVSNIISGGRRVAPAAILYHGDSEWAGEIMQNQKPARALTEAQIDFDFLPADVFLERESYNTEIGKTLKVNTQEYSLLIVPEVSYVSSAFVGAVEELNKAGFVTVFINSLPAGVYDFNGGDVNSLKTCPVVRLEELAAYLDKNEVYEVKLSPADTGIRCMHYLGESNYYFFINYGENKYCGEVEILKTGNCYAYNAWENRLEKLSFSSAGNITKVKLELDSGKGTIVVFGEAEGNIYCPPTSQKSVTALNDGWTRSICSALDYPDFSAESAVSLPDNVAEERQDFSGFVRYEREVEIGNADARRVLEISNAYEGVELFVNGVSAGIQVVPTFTFEITGMLKPGKNHIAIEVATTLEREVHYNHADSGRRMSLPSKTPTLPTGLYGTVTLTEVE